MFKAVCAVAFVALQLSSAAATGCGALNRQCCANNVCTAPRSACWEGTCMPCGKDGKPACPSGEKCDAGTMLKDGWCVHDNGPVAVRAPPGHCGWLNEACCPGDRPCLVDRGACWEGTCMKCGINGMPKCESGAPCDEGNVVNADGWCSTYNPPHPGPEPSPRGYTPTPPGECGKLDRGCCANNVCTDPRSACWEGTCMPCGEDGKPVCPKEPKCSPGNMEKDDFCVHDNSVDAPTPPPAKKDKKKKKKWF